ncbi:MAG: rhomboid family intramembrane serine protease [Balneolaceae bacterium]|nr:rhomboid family intramembrane serine protease [Balneolaceae bacterium]MBO6546625.1 rhomboid family intramembrane serine protease [Balneolaceae bacterium]MBO6648983.1 rhomboid family intramembrane serine protease [Balneolaceae bacterium]
MATNSFGYSVKRGFAAMPDALRAIILLNTATFVAQFVFFAFFGIDLSTYLGLNTNIVITITQPWRIVTYMFLHSMGNLFHFIFNMLWLWWMGRPVEERLGPRSFLTIYFGAGLAGALVDVALSFAAGTTLVIGASGAVFGVMVAFAMLFPRTPIMLFLLPPIEARYVVGGLIALDIIFLNSGGQVARLVHLGGALGGFLLMRAHKNGFDLSLIPRYFEYLYRKFKPSGAPKTKKRNKKMSIVSDADVIEEVDQSELDEILEKISKKGYDALSKEEKKKLFELSKKD